MESKSGKKKDIMKFAGTLENEEAEKMKKDLTEERKMKSRRMNIWQKTFKRIPELETITI